jgi:hypothetical protein
VDRRRLSRAVSRSGPRATSCDTAHMSFRVVIKGASRKYPHGVEYEVIDGGVLLIKSPTDTGTSHQYFAQGTWTEIADVDIDD